MQLQGFAPHTQMIFEVNEMLNAEAQVILTAVPHFLLPQPWTASAPLFTIKYNILTL